MNSLTKVLSILVIVLVISTGYLGYRLSVEPTKSEVVAGLSTDELATVVAGLSTDELATVLTGLSSDELATMKALIPVSGFSVDDVAGEIGGAPFVDDLGREVYINSAVNRIVSLNPAAEETIFGLGADSKLVAVSNAWVEGWISTPEDIVTKIKTRVSAGGITALDAFSVEPEAILNLEPDVVITFGYSLPAYAEAIKNAVPVLCFAPTSLQDVLRDLVIIGKVTNKNVEAKSMVEGIKADIADTANTTVKKSRPKVFCEISSYGGIYTTGRESFISSLITLAGGEDIGTAVSTDNPIISPEYIVSSEPDIIILLDSPWETAATVAKRSGWDQIPAVANGKIYELATEANDEIQRSGPRIAEGLKVLLGIIHPELSQ